jgi:copper(I)-binding protein
MHHMRRLVFALGLVVLTAGSVTAHETKQKSLTIIHPWVHETEASQAVLHVKIKNAGSTGERLLRATTPLAAKVTVLDAQGREAKSLAISRRGELSVQPGGPQILLSGLTKPLRAYDSFGLVLVFEKSGEVNVEVTVEEAENESQSGG